MKDEGNIQLKLIPKQNIPEFPAQEWDVYGDSNDNQQGRATRDGYGRRDFTAGLTFINKKYKKYSKSY